MDGGEVSPPARTVLRAPYSAGDTPGMSHGFEITDVISVLLQGGEILIF